jgi:hypothetical protein
LTPPLVAFAEVVVFVVGLVVAVGAMGAALVPPVVFEELVALVVFESFDAVPPGVLAPVALFVLSSSGLGGRGTTKNGRSPSRTRTVTGFSVRTLPRYVCMPNSAPSTTDSNTALRR